MSHVKSSETGMPVQSLMGLIERDGDLMDHVRGRRLPEPEDTLGPLRKVRDDGSLLFYKLLKWKNTPASLASKARHTLALEKGKCNK